MTRRTADRSWSLATEGGRAKTALENPELVEFINSLGLERRRRATLRKCVLFAIKRFLHHDHLSKGPRAAEQRDKLLKISRSFKKLQKDLLDLHGPERARVVQARGTPDANDPLLASKTLDWVEDLPTVCRDIWVTFERAAQSANQDNELACNRPPKEAERQLIRELAVAYSRAAAHPPQIPTRQTAFIECVLRAIDPHLVNSGTPRLIGDALSQQSEGAAP